MNYDFHSNPRSHRNNPKLGPPYPFIVLRYGTSSSGERGKRKEPREVATTPNIYFSGRKGFYCGVREIILPPMTMDRLISCSLALNGV